MHWVTGEQFAQQRIDLPCPTIQDFRPVELGKAVGEALGLDRIVELDKRVVLLHEAQFFLRHLLGKPFVAIDVELDDERQPGLQTNVDQSELGIEEVIIKDPLLPKSTDEPRTIGTRYECKGGTRFLGGEDADEPLGDALIADEVLCLSWFSLNWKTRPFGLASRAKDTWPTQVIVQVVNTQSTGSSSLFLIVGVGLGAGNSGTGRCKRWHKSRAAS